LLRKNIIQVVENNEQRMKVKLDILIVEEQMLIFSKENFKFTHQSDICHKVRSLEGKKTEKQDNCVLIVEEKILKVFVIEENFIQSQV
jgi:hypothetical protein